ncbi:unnamed protein product [Symbiodinium sp. CCMP2592]|nr:unnamed protein product [Symbiodinium sp. CCMP2592]
MPPKINKKAKKAGGPSKAELSLRKAAQTTLEQGQQQTLDELMEWLQANPAQAGSILASIKTKAWDLGPAAEEECDKLPPYMNKLKTLPKGKLIDYITDLVPGMGPWLLSLDRKTKKEELSNILAYLVHMHPASALTTKRESKLKKDLKERWSLYGERAKTWEAEGGVEAFWTQNGYWSLDIDADGGQGFLVFSANGESIFDKNRVALPDDMISDNTTLEGGHLFDGALIKKGALMRGVAHLLSELGIASRWEKPLFLKEVPGDSIGASAGTGGPSAGSKTDHKKPKKDKKRRRGSSEDSSSSRRRSSKSKHRFSTPMKARRKKSEASSPFSSKSSSASPKSKASPNKKTNKKSGTPPKKSTPTKSMKSQSPSPKKKAKSATPPKGNGSVLVED